MKALFFRNVQYRFLSIMSCFAQNPNEIILIIIIIVPALGEFGDQLAITLPR